MISKIIVMYIFICFFISSFVQFRAVYSFSSGRWCHVHESISLLEFQKGMLDFNDSLASSYCDDIGEYSYPKMKSWNKTNSPDCCEWDGVTCHVITGHIIFLDLSCSKLRGFIHHNSSLFQLSHLQKLNLARNNFLFSKLSPNIGKLSRLSYLNLSASLFKGIIPSDLSHLSKLVLLDLSFNMFLNFTPGNFHILLLNLSHIRVLSFDYLNVLSSLPANWTPSSLTYLDIGHAGLYGKLPESIFHLTQMRMLSVNGNKNLRVSIPKRIPNSTTVTSSLQVLDLSSTNFDAHGFNDNSLQFFPLLESLSLSECEITGSFPISIANLTQMVELDLSLNKFTGDFSSVISSLPAKLAKLNLNWNSFTGQLPSHIGNLTHLRLKCNFLKGKLPVTLSAFPKLSNLQLASNAFNGKIPFWLFSSQSITHLDLSRNRFTGQITEFTTKSFIQIDLSSNNLNGFIDFKVFENLTKLETLKLSDNKLSLKFEGKTNLSFPDLLFLGLSSCDITKFPSFLINSKNLISLDLSNNKLTGQIPNMISRYYLNYLNLSYNSISGLGFLNSLSGAGSLKALPLTKTLEVLDLSSNMFHKKRLPLSICSFKGLYILDLSHNNFMGSIPECYGCFNNVFRMLNLENNNLGGIISMKFLKDNKLMNLNLNRNSLQGTLPRSLGNCKNLKVLNVGNNRIKDAFPNLKNLTNLEVLILKSNRFSGSISKVKNEFFFPKLRVFDLSCNDFNGLLPVELLRSFKAMTTSDTMVAKASPLGLYKDESELYQFPISFTMKGGVYQFNGILTTLVAIDLSSNHFVGEIPAIIGNLNSLRILNLSHNNISGPIPLSLGKLHCLESLDLSSNMFEGMIPWQLEDITFLEILNLSENRLVGRIPQGKQFNTFSKDSYNGNLGLCGFPLTIKCKESNLSLHSSHASSYQDDKGCCFRCELTWKEFLIGYIFGILFGCFIFIIRKPRWLVRNVEEVCW